MKKKRKEIKKNKNKRRSYQTIEIIYVKKKDKINIQKPYLSQNKFLKTMTSQKYALSY